MLTYPDAVNSTSTTERPVRRVTGQFVARARLTRQQRAELAADLADGSVQILPPTAKQAAMLVAVPVVEVTRVRRTGKPKSIGSSKAPIESLAEHLARSSPAELQEAARVFGIQVIWDFMIAPVIAAEQTAAE
jgi:hypothetical protein